MDNPAPARRRRWPIFLPFAVVVVLGVAWSALWYYAAATAETVIATWREREAQRGRIYRCGSQSIGGYPFRIEVRCGEPAAEFRGLHTPLTLKWKDALVAAQIYQPTLLIGEFTGPLAFGDSGRSPDFNADWSLAQISLRGTPGAPERVSVVFDAPNVARASDGRNMTLASAKRAELHGRLVGSSGDHPIDLVMRLVAASAPGFHPAASDPLDAEVTAVLRGLMNFSPKPWPVLLREFQAA